MIYDKPSVLRGLRESFGEVSEYLAQYTVDELERAGPGGWSVADHFRHLILSTKPIASALKRSDEELRKICVPKGTSRRYDVLLEDYRQALVRRKGQSTPPFFPDSLRHHSIAELQAFWTMILEKFTERLDDWSEERLDANALPHPALGILSMREMLLFTILHNRHHKQGMIRLMQIPA